MQGGADAFSVLLGIRNRYLNIMEGALTGILYEDPPADGQSRYNLSWRLLGQDWPSLALTMIGSTRMRNLRYLCERVVMDRVPGDFIETGVWRGGACIFMKAVLEAYGDHERRVFVADSFCGLPAPNPDKYPADTGDPHHTFRELRISRAQVESNFRRFGLLDDRVVFLEGWFKDTLATAPVEKLGKR